MNKAEKTIVLTLTDLANEAVTLAGSYERMDAGKWASPEQIAAKRLQADAAWIALCRAIAKLGG